MKNPKKKKSGSTSTSSSEEYTDYIKDYLDRALRQFKKSKYFKNLQDIAYFSGLLILAYVLYFICRTFICKKKSNINFAYFLI